MYLRSLKIEHLKRFERFELSFERPDGSPRLWTVLIGENGTGKTSLLQAITLASVGSRLVNALAAPVADHLRDRRTGEAMSIQVEFSFDRLGRAHPRDLPGLADPVRGPRFGVASRVGMAAGEATLSARSGYLDVGPSTSTNGRDPLDAVRARNLGGWFVGAYGVSRVLPDVGAFPKLAQPAIERLRPLLEPHAPLVSTGFANLFQEDSAKRARFERLLARVMETADLLPGVAGVRLQGRGGVKVAGDLLEQNTFTQRVGATRVDLPINGSSSGFQSVLAWVIDLVGHFVLESDGDFELEDMVGVVLIDELDLHLHPAWQVRIVRALRKTFPNLQFVVTTHSPLVLAGLRPEVDEIVRLALDPETGDIRRVPLDHDDPRLLTGTELLKRYFSIDDIHPDEAGRSLREYRYLAANPFRSADDDAEMERHLRQLRAEGIAPGVRPVSRQGRKAR